MPGYIRTVRDAIVTALNAARGSGAFGAEVFTARGVSVEEFKAGTFDTLQVLVVPEGGEFGRRSREAGTQTARFVVAIGQNIGFGSKGKVNNARSDELIDLVELIGRELLRPLPGVVNGTPTSVTLDAIFDADYLRQGDFVSGVLVEYQTAFGTGG